MKIFIEGNPIFQKRTGVGQYTKRLFEEVAKIDKTNTYTFFAFLFAGKKKPEEPIKLENVRYKYVRTIPNRVYYKLLRRGFKPKISYFLDKEVDLFIFPNFVNFPVSAKQKYWIFVYDVSFITYPQYSEKTNKDFLIKNLPESISDADKVITISESSKSDIEKNYPASKGKIEIVHPGINLDEYKPAAKDKIKQVKGKFKITGDYILYTGTLEPRKNIIGILDAYDGLSEELQNKYTLVLAGGKGWQDEQIRSRLDDMKDKNIITTGYVDDSDLPPLYSGAAIFLYPSFYEGFGMPPLEAMACGVPVVTANNSSLPEVVGDAAILVDANDTGSITGSIQKVLNDPVLRKRMIKTGLKQSKEFTWAKSAKKFYDMVENSELG